VTAVAERTAAALVPAGEGARAVRRVVARIMRAAAPAEWLSYVNPKLELRTKASGERGVFATRPIKRGEILSISAGIGVPREVVRRLPRSFQKYCYFVENDFFYCPLTDPPTAEWFINHSCRPNASSPREPLTMRALKPIAPGDEVTYDYGEDFRFARYRPLRRFTCTCGARRCRRLIRY